MSWLPGGVFGGVVVVALIVTAAVLNRRPDRYRPSRTPRFPVRVALALTGLVLFAVDVFAVSIGAGIESSQATRYTGLPAAGTHRSGRL